MSSCRSARSLASLLIALLLAFTIPAGALRAQMNNSWQLQQQRQQEMQRQQQMQQEQLRRQQQEQLRQQQRQQLQAQQRQQMQAQQRQQMQAQQRQAMQQQQQQALQKQQRDKLQKQQLDQAKTAQQGGKPPPQGTPAYIANKPTGPMVFSNGVARLTRPLTPAEISRGFTGKVTPNGRALIKFQGRIFAVPASRVSGLTAKLAAQQRQPSWTAQQQGSVNEKVKKLAASTYRRTEATRYTSDGSIAKEQTRIAEATAAAGNGGVNDGNGGDGTNRPPAGDGRGPCDPRKSLTCNFNTQATTSGPVQVVKSPAVQARIDAARTATLQNQKSEVVGAGGAGPGNSAIGPGDDGKKRLKDEFNETANVGPLASTENLMKAALIPDKGGLTVAGRALQKHGNRAGSAFISAKGTAESINQQAEKVVQEILNNPGRIMVTRNHARFGLVTEIRVSDGRGLRFDAKSGRFIGFLEPGE